MQQNFQTAIQFTAAREGLFQCARADDGNWTLGRAGHGALVGTMRGISAPTLVRWLGDPVLVTKARMKCVSATEMAAIAAAFYWRPLNGAALPAGVDLMLFDFGFNAGIARAVMQAQQVLGFDKADIDGDLGAETLSAIADVTPAKLAGSVSGVWAKQLQRDLGLTADGVIGPRTLLHVGVQKQTLRMFVYALAGRQEAAYRADRLFSVEGDGWLKRLSDRVTSSLALMDAEAG